MKHITLVSTAGPVRAVVTGANRLSMETEVNNDEWFRPQFMFRLRLTGTGTCTMYAKNYAGDVTEVATYTANEATNQIEFPYPGDDAIEVRFSLTGQIYAEIL